MKGKLIRSDMIRRLVATFLNQLVNVSVTIQTQLLPLNTDSLSDSFLVSLFTPGVHRDLVFDNVSKFV